MANFLKARGAWDNKPTTVSSYVGKDAVKPAEKKPKLDAKVLNSYVGKKMAEAASVKVHQPGYNPPKQEHISSAEDLPSGEETALILGGKKSLDKIKEAAVKKAEPPFEPDPKPSKPVTPGKHGEGYSRARHLARKGLQQMLQINPKIAEGWSDTALDQLAEVHPSIMAMAKVAGNQSLKAQADKHTQMALQANKAGDDEKVRFHQAQVAKIKSKMQAENFDTTEFSKHVKNIRNLLGAGSTTRERGRGFGPTHMKHKLSIEDAKKKLHAAGYKSSNISHHKPVFGGDNHVTIQPSNSLKEDNLDELKATTLQSYADKAHQQALDATYDAAHLNRSGEEQLKANAKKLAAKRAGGVQRAQTKLDRMSEEMTDQVPTQFAHGIADVVQCKRTQRLASIISAEDDKYTVVYADGSTETGPADYWSAIRPVTEGRVVEQPRGWNVKHLKPAGHGIVGKKVRSYDFPGMHDSHYIEGHVTDEDPQSYHIRTTKVVRHHKEEPVSSHMMHIRAPKGMSLFGGAQGVYYAPKEMKPAAKKTMRGIRGKK